MQRKLLALAVASAFAVPGAAFAQVTISGAMRFSVDNVDWSDSTSAPGSNTNNGVGVNKWGMTGHSANIKFQSRENLGGGLTAWMALESGIATGRVNGGNFGWFGRNTGAGIDSTSWGTIMGGQWDSPYKSVDGAWSIGTPAAYSYSATAPIFGRGDTTGTMPNPNCSTSISGAGFTDAGAATSTYCAYSAGSATSFQRRLANTVQWWSPVWNGVQLLLATQTNGVKTSGNNTNAPTAGTITKHDPSLWSGALRWAGPKWTVVGGYEQHKNFQTNAGWTGVASDNRLGTDKAWKIGGNYNFGVVQVALAYEDLSFKTGTIGTGTDHKESNWYIGGAFPIGNGAIRAAYAQGKVSGSNNGNIVGTNSTSDANGKMYNLSYEYNLSKRTMVYAAYAYMKQSDQSARNFGTNVEGPNGWQQNNFGKGADPRYISFGINHNF
jgi:predicted porin